MLNAISPTARILVLRLSAIGDVLHATAVVRTLREKYPRAHITWLVSPPADSLLRDNPDIDRLLVWDRRPVDAAFASGHVLEFIRLVRAAKSQFAGLEFDVALDIQGLFMTGVLALFSGASRRIGIHERHEGNPLFMTEMARDIADPHKIHRYLTALEPLGIERTDFTPGLVLPLPTDSADFAARFWAEHGITPDYERLRALKSACAAVTSTIAEQGTTANEKRSERRPLLLVNIRTTWPDKNYPPEKFAAALAPLPASVQIVFCGAPGDRPYIEQAQAAINHPTLSIAGETSLLELAALIKSATLLLTADTGPLHIADAVGARTLSLWGPTHPDIYGPLTEGHTFILTPHDCHSCCKTHCRHKTNACINAIEPTVITERLTELLKLTTFT